MPTISDIAGGRVQVDDLLQIEISDLLGRVVAEPNKELLKIKNTDKVVLISGAGGSIGSELARQIMKLKPKKFL